MKIKNNEEYIFSVLRERIKIVESYGYEWVGIFLNGSQNYNLAINNKKYQSDTDCRVIVLPSVEQIYKKENISMTLEVGERKEHIDIKDISEMFNNFKKQNINFTEILFTKYKILNPKYSDIFSGIYSFAEELAYSNMPAAITTMTGISKQKLNAVFSDKYSATKDNVQKYGYDGRQLYHIIRINDFIKRFLKHEKYSSVIIPGKKIQKLCIKAKLQKLSLKDAKTIAEKYDSETVKLRADYLASYDLEAMALKTKEANEKLDELGITLMKKYLSEQILLNIKEKR